MPLNIPFQVAAKGSIFNTCRPPEGSVYVPVQLPFTVQNQSLAVDLTQAQNTQGISYIQSIFVNNSNNAQRLDLVMGGPAAQVVPVPAGWVGWVSVLAINPVNIIFNSAVAVNTLVSVYLCNFPANTFLWPSAPLGSSTTPLIVSDAVLDALLAGGFLPVKDQKVASGGVLVGSPQADTTLRATQTAVGPVAILAGVAGQRYYIENITLSIDQNAALAAAAEFQATVAAGALVLAELDTFLPNAAATTNFGGLRQSFPVRNLVPANTAINLTLSGALTSGNVRVAVSYALGAF